MHECADARLTLSICHSPPYLCMYVLYVFIDRVSVYISDWLGTHREPFASGSQVLVLKMYGTFLAYSPGAWVSH